MSDLTIADMINSASRASPSDFQVSFTDVLLGKVAAAIDQKRQEVAKNYFATDEEQSVEETEDSTENEENTDENTTADSEPEEQR